MTRSWGRVLLSYGCCLGSSWTVSEIPELFPCLARTIREISLHSNRISSATDLSSCCFVVLGCTFAEGEILLLYYSDGNPTVGKAVFFNLVWSLKFPSRNIKDICIHDFGIMFMLQFQYLCKWTGLSQGAWKQLEKPPKGLKVEWHLIILGDHVLVIRRQLNCEGRKGSKCSKVCLFAAELWQCLCLT